MNEPQLFNFHGQQVNTANRGDYFGYFYVLECSGILKIGSTKNPRVRLQQLKQMLENYGNNNITKMYISKPCKNYKENERVLQNYFSTVRIKNTELFRTDVKQVLKVASCLKLKNNSELQDKKSKEVTAKLVAMMKENNWTQVKLAERLHVSQQVISRTITEKGTIKMSPLKVEMMYQLIAKPYPASDIQI